MNQPFYHFTVLDQALRYEFVSEGERTIRKTIVYYATTIPSLYSLTLADVLGDDNLDVYAISDNGDMPKILATVFQSIVSFLSNYPNAIVGFKGSTLSRTRLYQIAIARELDKAIDRFKVWGVRSDTGELETFRNGITYESFFVSLKDRY